MVCETSKIMDARKVIVMIIYILRYIQGQYNPFCENNITLSQNCSTQISGNKSGSCELVHIAPESSECHGGFSAVLAMYNLSQVTIKPYIFQFQGDVSYNYTVPNIIFSDIRWKKLKFRIQKHSSKKRHCRHITISDDASIASGTVLYYNCYWSLINGNYKSEVHILDMEATDYIVVERRQFLFFIPSHETLNPAGNGTNWKPFVYVEHFKYSARIHIMPPPPKLNITAYEIKIMEEFELQESKNTSGEKVIITANINSDQEIYEYSNDITSGIYYFLVTPYNGEMKYQSVKSPSIFLHVPVDYLLYACIIVSVIFILISIALYWFYRNQKKLSDIPLPPKVVVIYSTSNVYHAKCVSSFVDCLRSDYGLDVLYDRDISKTVHWDPYFWAEDAMKIASHVMYIVGPKEKPRISVNNYENLSINPLYNVDRLLLSFLKAARASNPSLHVMNVFFEHSDGSVPSETQNDKSFHLLRDWQKLIAHLSRNLLPKNQIMRSERGKSFMESLKRLQMLSDG